MRVSSIDSLAIFLRLFRGVTPCWALGSTAHVYNTPCDVASFPCKAKAGAYCGHNMTQADTPTRKGAARWVISTYILVPVKKPHFCPF